MGNFMKGFHVCFGVSDRVGPFSPHREVVIQSIWSETCRENADQWWDVGSQRGRRQGTGGLGTSPLWL